MDIDDDIFHRALQWQAQAMLLRQWVARTFFANSQAEDLLATPQLPLDAQTAIKRFIDRMFRLESCGELRENAWDVIRTGLLKMKSWDEARARLNWDIPHAASYEE